MSILKPVSSAEMHGTLSAPLLSPNGRWLYVLDRTASKLLKLNAATLQTVCSAAAPDRAAIALGRDGRSVFVVAPRKEKDAAGVLLVLDSATLAECRSIALPAEPFDVAAGANGRVFVSGGGSGWTEITVVDAEAATLPARWGGVWARSFVALTSDGSRLLTSTQRVTPGRVEALPMPEPFADKPDAYAAPAEVKVGGPFVVTSDGQYMICSTGTVLRLATKRSEDLQPVADIGLFQAAAADPEHGSAFVLREDGTLDVLTYPEFKPRSSRRTGIAGYGMALDAQAGRLYVAGIPLAALRDRQRAKAIGDVMIFDVRELQAVK
jgi:hypothetical protein